jgi:preprotein translocase subunit SecA
VLNAKPENAEREGETIAEAGAPGAVTIATNMAGRGVDIKLGGNAEHLPSSRWQARAAAGMPDYEEHFEKVLPEIERRVEAAREQVLSRRPVHPRHRASRVAPDRQPAARPRRPPGRPGRVALLPLGPGRPRAPVRRRADLQDPRSPRHVDEEGNEEPIEAGMLSKQIEKAQRKVEEQHFLQRKHTLEYDDVLNQQREVIYHYRDEVLEGRDMSEAAREEIVNVIERTRRGVHGGDFVEDWDLDGLCAGSRRSSRPQRRDPVDRPTGSTVRS